MNKRIYVCHTFYHVYISILKEFNRVPIDEGGADILLSKMSNDFRDIDVFLRESGIFGKVLFFDEKRDTFFESLDKYRIDRKNIVLNMFSRVIYTKKFAKLQEPYVPVDFSTYDDIYVFCDNDPIGIYLSQHHIRYHAVEDGLNCLRVMVPAYYDNKGAFKIKKFLSDKLNLIFIRDGFNKYCIDMEVNDISLIGFPCKKYVEVPRKKLVETLTTEQKDKLIKVFVRNIDQLQEKIQKIDDKSKNILILTEPLCDLVTRKRIFTDLLNTYSKEGTVFFKPHPRDGLDYEKEFGQVPRFDAYVPMEILNFFPNLHFDKVISIFTQIDAIEFADEKVKLGPDFMDRYEDPQIHRW